MDEKPKTKYQESCEKLRVVKTPRQLYDIINDPSFLPAEIEELDDFGMSALTKRVTLEDAELSNSEVQFLMLCDEIRETARGIRRENLNLNLPKLPFHHCSYKAWLNWYLEADKCFPPAEEDFILTDEEIMEMEKEQTKKEAARNIGESLNNQVQSEFKKIQEENKKKYSCYPPEYRLIQNQIARLRVCENEKWTDDICWFYQWGEQPCYFRPWFSDKILRMMKTLLRIPSDQVNSLWLKWEELKRFAQNEDKRIEQLQNQGYLNESFFAAAVKKSFQKVRNEVGWFRALLELLADQLKRDYEKELKIGRRKVRKKRPPLVTIQPAETELAIGEKTGTAGDKKTKRGRQKKYTPEMLEAMHSLFEDEYEKTRDKKGSWYKVAKTFDIKTKDGSEYSGKAAEMAWRRGRKKQNK
jgi:hypothetical protein